MADNPRIEDLRRRVRTDPASIAFAQLAEEYRRSGDYREAIETCRAGLTTHPGYLSARVTLGRALIEVNELDAAETELRLVLRSASENLAAIRGLAEIHHRRDQLPEALEFYKTALGIARHDPDLEQTIDEITRALTPDEAPADEGLSFAEAEAEFLAALDGFEALGAEESLPEPPPATATTGVETGPFDQKHPGAATLPELERFLVAIHAYRRRRPAV